MPLSSGQIHFKFKGCLVVIYNFIEFSKVHSVRNNAEPASALLVNVT